MNLPPNLAALGHKRLVSPEPDMETLRLMQSPVWLIYQEFKQFLTPTSGYRDGSDGVGARISEHHLGLAGDFAYRSFDDVCWVISHLFNAYIGPDTEVCYGVRVTRIGLYPHRNFVHIGTAPDEWIEHYNKARWWHENKDGKIIVHKTLKETIRTAEEEL